MADALPESSELFQKFKEKAKKYFRCLTCEGNRIFEKTHFTSRDKTEPNHVKEMLSTEERNDWIQGEIKKQLEENTVAPQLASATAQRVPEPRQQGAVGEDQGPECFRLDFGMFKRSTISDVMRRSPLYFASLVQQTPRNQEPLHNR
jgi:hypothetical protein